MSGCSVPTIRHYQEVGLIAPASRRSSGHRVYDAKAVQLLAFIRRCRDFGFGIEQTPAMLSLAHGNAQAPGFVDGCNATCAGGSAPQCTILKDLAGTG